MSLSLGRFQDAFVDALQGVEPAALDEADRLIATLTAQPGFAVYRNTVMKGCVDALRANFPTVERLVLVGFFCSIATAGLMPSTRSTSGFSMRSRNCLAYDDSDST